ncbi:CorA family divalent cation transporter [Brochothrix campestris]|uniref:CorA family divalent cation transporter n=1 Tax=Brochothrix campestris TaxID=2757 RepID=UPI0038CFC521
MSFIFTDAKKYEIIDILPSRRLHHLRDYFLNYSYEARASVKTIVTDMNAPYGSLIKEVFPNADTIIDRFHLSQLVTRSLNQTRIRLFRQSLNYVKIDLSDKKRGLCMIEKTRFNQQQNCWINVNTTQEHDLKTLFATYGIDEEIIGYSLDKNERAHLDYDKTTNTFVFIYNVPNQTKIDNHYETIPMTFIIKGETLITISNDRNHYLISKMAALLKQNETVSVFGMLFNSLLMITDQFFPYVEELNLERNKVSQQLKVKTTKKTLLSLSDLETGIIFFISASKQNVVLLEQIKTHAIYKELDDVEIEELGDVLIEAKQLVEMTQLSVQILQQLSGTYNNILNNNLNDTMRILTVLSVLLTIPTVITGFFGMNMPLPLENNAFGWLITIIISVLVWLSLSFILRKMMNR